MSSSTDSATMELLEQVRQFIAGPTSAGYAKLLETVDEGSPEPAELATALLQVASALVQRTAALENQASATRSSPSGPGPEATTARKKGPEEVGAAVAETRERLGRAVFEAAAPAATRLPTLLQRRQSGQRVRVQEALDVATLLAEALTVLELQPLGTVGEVIPYDPRRHVPRYKKDQPLAPGTTVQVETVGYTCQGRVLRPALVVRVTSGE